ncbi:hypothetical protein BOX15_Mlig023755g1, partial [Macrostomum lignano]
RHSADMARQASVREEVAAALRAKDAGRLLPLCRQLDANFEVIINQLNQSIAHHVTFLSDGLRCFEALIKKLGPDCLTCTNQYGNTPVHLAALYRDESWMELIHRSLGSDCFRQPGRLQRTAIHFAAVNEATNSCLKWLVNECGTDCLSVRDQQGDTPVHLAAWKQCADSMQFFKSVLGSECFHQPGLVQRTAIHCAAENEATNSCLKWLVNECGTDCLSVRDQQGNTPVHLAAWKQGADSMQFFKSVLGSDCFHQPGLLQQTAIHWAALNGTNSCLKWLVNECGTDCLSVRDQHGYTPVHLAAWKQGADSMQFFKSVLGSECFHQPGLLQQTAIHKAALNEATNSCLKWLVNECGTDCLSVRDQQGNTPVHLAAWRQGADSMQFFKSVLGSDCFHQPGLLQRTAIHRAAVNEATNSCLKWLVNECGTDCLSVRDQQGNTPVHLAAWKQGADSMQFFKSVLGSDCFHQPGYLQRTAIHWAALNGTNSCLKWLVNECGTDCLSVRDQQGNTPVHLAAWRQGADSMQFFKSVLGSDCFHQPGNCQRTAIHHAATNEATNSCLKWLVNECGTDCLSVRDQQGNTPVHLAAWKQGADSMQFFKSVLGSDCFHQPGLVQRTAIHFAAMNETNSCLKWLISELGPACLLEKDSNGATPAHLAAQHHDLDSLRLIADSLGLAPFDFLDSGGESVADYAERNSQHGARIREWIAEQRRQQPDGEERRLGQAMSGLQLRRAVDAQSEETPSASARPALDPAFSSWDFLLDGDGNKQLLGAGGFGQVYKAFTDKRQTVAVKIVRLEGASSARLMDEAIEKENAEISVLKAIRHPNIVQFLKSERIKKGKLCIFTELISGHSLSELMQLQRRPFDEAAVRDFSKQICSALNFLHSRSPVTLHRDIKCSNLMLTNEGLIKLIDFGLAKEVFASMRSTKTECGTTYFMAPELFSEDGRIVYSPKTDVWAFGCSVFEMLEMKPPNWQLRWQQIPLRIRNHDMPQLPAGTSALMRDFYGRCIQREPRRRAATAELLEHKFLQ